MALDIAHRGVGFGIQQRLAGYVVSQKENGDRVLQGLRSGQSSVEDYVYFMADSEHPSVTISWSHPGHALTKVDIWRTLIFGE